METKENNTYLINDEIAYPIYSISAKWSQKGIQDPQYPNLHIDLPAGRIWNSSGFSFMSKEKLSDAELTIKATEWWTKFLDNKNNTINEVDNLILNGKFVRYETWVLTWFQHETFDIGQTDNEALNSFEQYVRRHEHLPYKHPENICLMGAEDRWRWHGAEPNGEPNDHSPAPCRCKFCKEQGKIRIGH